MKRAYFVKFWSKVLTIILVFLVVVNVFTYAFKNKEVYSQKYDYSYWQNRFDHSQYAQGDKSSFILSDAELNTFRGYQYVQKKMDMEKFIPGHPPLASYILAFSIVIFNNQYFASLIFGVITLLLLYKIGVLVTQNKLLSIVVTFLFSLEPIFLTQLNDSMLDIFQLCFGLAAVFFYLKWIKNDRFVLLLISQLFVGFVLSTKFVLSGAPLPIALTISIVLLNNFKKFKHYIYSLPLIGVGYLIGHLSYFFYHPSVISFIKYQRYIISWWFGSPQTMPLQVWDMIFFNRWHTWWGNLDIVPIDLWRFTWPVIFGISIFSFILFIFRRGSLKYILSLYLWLVISMLLYSFETVYPRHLLFIFPVAYLLSLMTLTGLANIKAVYTKR